MMGQFLVRSILAYDLTESPFALGVLSFVVAIPMLFISPIGGALADRLDRRRLIMLAQILVLVDEVITLILISVTPPLYARRTIRDINPRRPITNKGSPAG